LGPAYFSFPTKYLNEAVVQIDAFNNPKINELGHS